MDTEKGFASRPGFNYGFVNRSLVRHFLIILHISIIFSMILAGLYRTPFITLAKAKSPKIAGQENLLNPPMPRRLPTLMTRSPA
jgi:hypothetical protein